MADEVELVDNEVESDGGASEQIEDVAPADSQDEGQRQPKPEREEQADFSKLDLSELPQFREYQSRQDQRLAQLQREAEQARKEAQEARMAGMDDFEKVQYERDLYHNQYMTLQQQLEEQRALQEAMQYRDQQLRQIAQETGVPIEELDSSSPDAAWRSALMAIRQKETQAAAREAQEMLEQAQDQAQERVANTVDLGGGSPQTQAARARAQFNQLRRQKAPATDLYKVLLQNG